MKYGYRLVIHNSIKDNQIAIEKMQRFLHIFSSKNSYKYGWHSPFKRNGVGVSYRKDWSMTYDNDGEFVFKRVSKNRRIFAMVPRNLVEGELHRPCSHLCSDGKAKLKVGYEDENYTTFAEVGDIKG